MSLGEVASLEREVENAKWEYEALLREAQAKLGERQGRHTRTGSDPPTLAPTLCSCPLVPSSLRVRR